MHPSRGMFAIDVRRRWTAVSRTAAAEDGYTLTELLVVMAILSVVLGALTTLFVSGSRAQIDMSNRFEAQQNARLALDKLRREIHCASALPTYSTSSITITLGSYCPTNRTGATASFTWCTKDKAGATPPGAGPPYNLWRYSGAACSGTGQRQMWASYLYSANVFPTYPAPTPPSRELRTLGVDLIVDLTPSDVSQRYRLEDNIALRNSPRP